MSLTYTIKKDGVVVGQKTFTKSRCKYKNKKLFSKSGWAGYCMFYIDKVKYELSGNFQLNLK